jgi:multidrug efflux pump subunit AcrA (membrane-fusion protein)
METQPNVKRRRRYLVLAAAAVFASLWGVRRWEQYRMYKREMDEARGESDRALPVKTYKVRPLDVAGALRRIGTIRARAETNIQFGMPGRLRRFDVEKGRFVKKGALIAALDQEEAKNAMTAAEAEFQKASTKFFKDRTIDKLEFERAKARYNQARLDAAKTTAYAPHDGYLVEKWASAGEQVEGGTVIGKLMDKSSVSIEMDLSEDDIARLSVGQKVGVTVDAVPDFRGEGEVSSITPYLKGDSRSFNVKVTLPSNPEEKLNPGMFARCVIRRYEKTGAIVVPLEAAAETKEDKVKVFVVGDDNVAHARTLDKVFSDEKIIEVSGLKEGDQVVLNPSGDLQDGAKVGVTGVYDPASSEGTPKPETEAPKAETPVAK